MQDVKLHPEAEFELSESVHYYDDEDLNLGSRFTTQIKTALNLIRKYPDIGGMYILGTRRFLIREFPYFLIYKHYDDHIYIIAVAHCRRKPDYWRNRVKNRI